MDCFTRKFSQFENSSYFETELITMPPVTLEGDTLGKKRQHYNKLVEDAIANKHYELCNISGDDSDIDNLLKIDIASKNRNVDYIIEVMKSNDMLYAATAIKKSTWLITEQQYANIINPEYLHTQLLPSMNTKTFNKLMLHIRLNLKDESRVEAFYEYLKETDSAYKWLQNCSIPFIENVIKNGDLIPLSLFKRLCTRSAHFLTYSSRVEKECDVEKEILFLLKSHTADVLTVLEAKKYNYLPVLGTKKTETIMKTCPQRILDNFKKYADIIDLSVVAKYLEKKEIKPFLFKQINKYGQDFCEFNKLRHFVKNMPKEEKLEFIQQTFIDRTDLTFLRSEDEKDTYTMDLMFYVWYEYFPFNIALPELKKLILAENSPRSRFKMLSVLITCAKRNPQHITTLLHFFYERHVNEPFTFKIQFVNHLLSQISTHEFDVETWYILDQLFHSMEVYTESKNDVQLCFESIVLYKVLHDEPVPKIVEEKMTFNTFEKVQRKLNQEQRSQMFTYLFNLLLTKIQIENIANESDFEDTLLLLQNALILLRDWKKDISQFPFVLEKIQELIKIKQENMWKTEISCLYFIKKSWRKHMFEESLSLCLSEEACLNALKHKPQLLTRHDKEIDTLRTNDAVSLKRLLPKLRVYWPLSLAQNWIDAYLLHLNKPTGQKAVVKGLFMLLSQSQIVNLAKTHAPDNFKITWGETDQTEISIRKNIAKHLHVTRPLIPLEAVLLYSNGDYLQYAIPSLNSIMSKMNQVESRKHVLKLLEAPVSLRKLGIRVALAKLKPCELKTFINNIWNTTTNSTIRTAIFRNTFDYICKVKNTTVEKELWTSLSMFIDKLPPGANKAILRCLGNVRKVPLSVQAEFYMKSYAYLTSVLDSTLCFSLVNALVLYANYTTNIVDSFDDDFVTDKLLSPAGTKFCMRNSEFIDIFGRYVLWGKSEEDQLQRFRRVIDPAMEVASIFWRKTKHNVYYVQNNFKEFIQYLLTNYKDFTLSRRTTPTKLFTKIMIKMEKNMQLLEIYTLYTTWKLLTEHAKLMEQHLSEMGNAWLTGEKEKMWNEINFAISPAFGTRIVECLKEDTKQYFPSICLLFADALQEMNNGLFSCNSEFEVEILKHMLNDPDFTPSYVVVSRATNKNVDVSDSLKRIRTEIRNKLKSHPSQEVKMHYYNDFKLPLDEIES